jgi:protein involved in polysaccharide export with SLBB domain
MTSPTPSRATKFALAALAVSALASCVSSPDKRVLQFLNTDGFGVRFQGNSLHDDYLTVGDSLSYRDSFNPSVNGQQKIAMDGTIDFDEIGRVWVAGMTREEAEVYLTEKASAYYPQSDVRVILGTNGKKYFIFGEVNTTGEKKITGDMTLFEAVMSAVPMEHSANLGRVRLIRPDPVEPLVIDANLGQMLQSGDSTFNTLVQDFDIIIVPPTMLAQVGYFISDLVYPFTTVFSTVLSGLVGLNNLGNKFGGNKNNKNQGIF